MGMIIRIKPSAEIHSGADPGFSFRGGGGRGAQKVMCQHACT